MSERIRSIRSATPTAAGKQRADEALQTLLDGFQRFRNDVFPEQRELFSKLARAARAVQQTGPSAKPAGHVHHLRGFAHRSRIDHPE